MSNKETGGPAFPTHAKFNEHGFLLEPSYSGMALRDYFAAHATEQDISAHWAQEYFFTREEAKYRYADEMLKARGVERD